VRISLIAGSALAGSLALAGLHAAAQDVASDGGPGPKLTFGLDQTFDTNSNLNLDVPSPGQSTQSLTGLSFGLVTETGLSTLSFDAATVLRILDEPNNTDTQFDIDRTVVDLAYARSTGNSTLTVDGIYTESQLDNLRTLADFGPGVDVPEDLSTLNGTGVRQYYNLTAGLLLEEDAPVSYQFDAGTSGLSYTNASDPTLSGNTRNFLGAAAIFQISPVTSASVGLNYGDFTSDNPTIESSNNRGIDLDLTRLLPNGSAGLNFFAEDYSDDGPRAGFSLSRDLDLPAGALSFSIGATRLQEASTELTGNVSWLQELPLGAINLEVSQNVINDSDNVPQLVTAVFAGYNHELTELSQIGVDMSYSWNETVNSPDWTETASFSATYSREVTRDWALDVGYQYQQRQDSGEPKANSNSVFLAFRRNWEMSP
jgi:hypothetical protein